MKEKGDCCRKGKRRKSKSEEKKFVNQRKGKRSEKTIENEKKLENHRTGKRSEKVVEREKEMIRS